MESFPHDLETVEVSYFESCSESLKERDQVRDQPTCPIHENTDSSFYEQLIEKGVKCGHQNVGRGRTSLELWERYRAIILQATEKRLELLPEDVGGVTAGASSLALGSIKGHLQALNKFRKDTEKLFVNYTKDIVEDERRNACTSSLYGPAASPSPKSATSERPALGIADETPPSTVELMQIMSYVHIHRWADPMAAIDFHETSRKVQEVLHLSRLPHIAAPVNFLVRIPAHSCEGCTCERRGYHSTFLSYTLVPPLHSQQQNFMAKKSCSLKANVRMFARFSTVDNTTPKATFGATTPWGNDSHDMNAITKEVMSAVQCSLDGCFYIVRLDGIAETVPSVAKGLQSGLWRAIKGAARLLLSDPALVEAGPDRALNRFFSMLFHRSGEAVDSKTPLRQNKLLEPNRGRSSSAFSASGMERQDSLSSSNRNDEDSSRRLKARELVSLITTLVSDDEGESPFGFLLAYQPGTASPTSFSSCSVSSATSRPTSPATSTADGFAPHARLQYLKLLPESIVFVKRLRDVLGVSGSTPPAQTHRRSASGGSPASALSYKPILSLPYGANFRECIEMRVRYRDAAIAEAARCVESEDYYAEGCAQEVVGLLSVNVIGTPAVPPAAPVVSPKRPEENVGTLLKWHASRERFFDAILESFKQRVRLARVAPDWCDIARCVTSFPPEAVLHLKNEPHGYGDDSLQVLFEQIQSGCSQFLDSGAALNSLGIPSARLAVAVWPKDISRLVHYTELLEGNTTLLENSLLARSENAMMLGSSSVMSEQKKTILSELNTRVAFMHIQGKDLDAAAQYLRKIIHRERQHCDAVESKSIMTEREAPACNNLGYVLYMKGKLLRRGQGERIMPSGEAKKALQESVVMLQEVLHQEAELPADVISTAYLNLANTKVELGDCKTAEEYFDSAATVLIDHLEANRATLEPPAVDQIRKSLELIEANKLALRHKPALISFEAACTIQRCVRSFVARYRMREINKTANLDREDEDLLTASLIIQRAGRAYLTRLDLAEEDDDDESAEGGNIPGEDDDVRYEEEEGEDDGDEEAAALTLQRIGKAFTERSALKTRFTSRVDIAVAFIQRAAKAAIQGKAMEPTGLSLDPRSTETDSRYDSAASALAHIGNSMRARARDEPTAHLLQKTGRAFIDRRILHNQALNRIAPILQRICRGYSARCQAKEQRTENLRLLRTSMQGRKIIPRLVQKEVGLLQRVGRAFLERVHMAAVAGRVRAVCTIQRIGKGVSQRSALGVVHFRDGDAIKQRRVDDAMSFLSRLARAHLSRTRMAKLHTLKQKRKIEKKRCLRILQRVGKGFLIRAKLIDPPPQNGKQITFQEEEESEEKLQENYLRRRDGASEVLLLSGPSDGAEFADYNVVGGSSPDAPEPNQIGESTAANPDTEFVLNNRPQRAQSVPASRMGSVALSSRSARSREKVAPRCTFLETRPTTYNKAENGDDSDTSSSEEFPLQARGRSVPQEYQESRASTPVRMVRDRKLFADGNEPRKTQDAWSFGNDLQRLVEENAMLQKQVAKCEARLETALLSPAPVVKKKRGGSSLAERIIAAKVNTLQAEYLSLHKKNVAMKETGLASYEDIEGNLMAKIEVVDSKLKGFKAKNAKFLAMQRRDSRRLTSNKDLDQMWEKFLAECDVASKVAQRDLRQAKKEAQTCARSLESQQKTLKFLAEEDEYPEMTVEDVVNYRQMLTDAEYLKSEESSLTYKLRVLTMQISSASKHLESEKGRTERDGLTQLRREVREMRTALGFSNASPTHTILSKAATKTSKEKNTGLPVLATAAFLTSPVEPEDPVTRPVPPPVFPDRLLDASPVSLHGDVVGKVGVVAPALRKLAVTRSAEALVLEDAEDVPYADLSASNAPSLSTAQAAPYDGDDHPTTGNLSVPHTGRTMNEADEEEEGGEVESPYKEDFEVIEEEEGLEGGGEGGVGSSLGKHEMLEGGTPNAMYGVMDEMPETKVR